MWMGQDGKPSFQGAALKHWHICYAVRDVDWAGAEQASRQHHALQAWSAGLAGVLTLSLLSLRAAVPAACL